MPESRLHFAGRVRKALDDPQLQRALTSAMTGIRARRDAGFANFDFEKGREDLKQRRRANLDRLPELARQFAERLEAVGGQVHFAADATEARDIIGQLCWNAAATYAPGAGVRPVVTKVKSMASEEIELNHYLESLGMEVVETDLGERMVQLTHTRPSHIIAPAIHLTKEDAADVFGTEPTVEAIQRHARASLRQKFIEAVVGISGANMAIAETGTVVLVTNEGNADLTVTLPPVHIALFGMDKLVSSYEDAIALLRMLTRSGTGQLITSYVNWITGPSRSADIEQSLTIGVHGPREMHCVILDNGRERMRQDPAFRDALTCIRCGACSNACPPFMAVGGHQFGHIYNGPIGLVLTPFHHGLAQADLSNTLCTQCNACQEACPVDIPLPRQILEHRRRGRKSLRKRALLGLWERPALADRVLRTGAPFSGAIAGAPRLAGRPYRDRAPQPKGRGEPLTIFASCMVDRAQPAAAAALERIAVAAGYDVGFPKDQWCCGLIAANAGDFEGACNLNTSLAQSLRDSKGPIVTPSASCFGAFTMDAPEWGAGEAAGLAPRFRDSTRFVLELLERRPDLTRPSPARPRVAYHDSCQTLRQLGLKAEPRRLLELCGYEVVEIPDIANCCGFGGTFSFEWPGVAARLAAWKLDAIARTGCEIVASDNPGCLVHIAAHSRDRSRKLRVAHVLELVAERLATVEPPAAPAR
ncbi:MAG TPA: LUD domain-containing protein [Candidatus Dormibacteraeota bacterium]|nr:LUD domain-containing protein [Candidatus Dormibacteraeota bacterium]